MSADVAKEQAPESARERMSPRSGIAMASIALLIGALTAAGVAWSQHLSDGGEVAAANVYFNGVSVTEMTTGQVRAMVELDADARRNHLVTIQFDDGSVDVPLSKAGFSYDVDETVESILATRHSGSFIDQLWDFVITPFSDSTVVASWSYDKDLALEYLAGVEDLTPRSPVEPTLTIENSDFLYVVSGKVGTTVDIEDVASQLERVDYLSPLNTLDATQIDVLPAVTDFEAEDAASRLNDLTSRGVTVSVLGHTTTILPHALRAHLIIEPSGDTLEATFDADSLHAEIEAAFPEPIGEFRPPTLSVFDDEVIIDEPGEPPAVCCKPGSSDWVGREILAGATGPFGVPPRPIEDPILEAWSDGSLIVEKVGEFTTPHSCCQSRVKNIQRIADIVRGAYLVPGETMSLNEFVGPRTRENGFVSAGAIRTGHFREEVGGGVSQFATTIFNAAYFAALDFDLYRSHTIYFSRYPYGREATISMPSPDLVFTNTTDYPILIWTSYTDRSITVSMYSTQHIIVEEIDQRVARGRACTYVETDRQRTYPDGEVVVDTIKATYRPAEGIDCNGNRIPPPPG